MNLATDFKSQRACTALLRQIALDATTSTIIMEVCGGHTTALYRYGITGLLPKTISMVSGPGCPVCVSDIRYIDHAIALARLPDVTVMTYGDLIRVPGSSSSLEKERAAGGNVRIVWSALDALKYAVENPQKKVVFLGIGFETTTPGTAIALFEAHRAGTANFYALCSHKVMPPAMAALIDDGVKIDAYLCPGHVSAVTGSGIYQPIVEKYKKPCVIAGFEPTDILQSILMIVRQTSAKRAAVEIQYTRVVKPDGNQRAQELIAEFFTPVDDWWRGLGIIPQSGLQIAQKYRAFDATTIPVTVEEPREIPGCICGNILKGLQSPVECKLFAHGCTPDTPVGACMVSSEGACSACFQYGTYEK